MKRFAFVLFLLPHVSSADDPFLCVDPDIREAFLPSYPIQTHYSTDLPDGFIEHPVPTSSVLIGSQVNDSYASVVYKTDDDVDLVVDGIVSSLEENGWQDIGRIAGIAGRGFQASTIPQFHRLCRDDSPGMLTVSSRGASGTSFVTIPIASLGNVQSCSGLIGGNRDAIRHMSLAEELPNLKLPEGVQTHNSGSGGGGDDYQTRIIVSTEMARESLASFLNDQIRDQGWNFDGAWSGSRSSGTAWFKESENGDLMIGTLHAFGDFGDTFNLRFSINLADTDRYSGRSAFSIVAQ